MYVKEEVLMNFYMNFMDRMDDDMEIADNFKGPLTDDYLEGIKSGLSAAQSIFRACYKEACRK